MDNIHYEEGQTHIVVDMQPGFLMNHSISNHMRSYVIKLIFNVRSHIINCIKSGGEIIYVETVGYGKTIPVLRTLSSNGLRTANGILKTKNNTLRKNMTNLLDKGNTTVSIAHDFLKKRVMEGRNFTIGGVNAPLCVGELARSLHAMGGNVKVVGGITMDTNSYALNCINNLNTNWGLAGLLELTKNPELEGIHRGSLLDYL